MHLRTTFFLMVLAALVLSYVFMREGPETGAPETGREQVKLLDFQPERVAGWSLAGARGFVECVSEHGQWLIVKPVKTRASDARVNYMLSVLASLLRGETITGDQRKARSLTFGDYGLEKPAYRLAIVSPDKRLEIDVGNVSPLKDSVYVRINGGDTVVATSTNLLAIMPGELADIRDRHLVYGAPAFARMLELKSQMQPLISLVKEGPEWLLRKPVLARADWLRLSALLDALFNVQIEQYVTDSMTDPALYGLGDDEAILQVGIWQNEKDKGEYFLFGKNADDKNSLIYACQRGQSSVFAVKAVILEALTAGLAGIRDSRLYFMAPGSVANIRMEEGGSVLRLVREEGAGWQIAEPKKFKADDKAVETLISRLNSLRIESFVPAATAAVHMIEKPAKIISVSDFVPPDSSATNRLPGVSGTPPAATRTLLLGASAQGRENVYGRFADEEEVYQISASAVATISLNPLFYRDSAIWSFDPASVTKIVLRKNNVEQVAAKDRAGKWQNGAAGPRGVNLHVIEDLLSAASRLRAVRFESDLGVAGMYGLQPAATALTFSLSGKEGINKTLLLGENSEDGGVYAMLQGQEFVFVLNRELVNRLLRDLLR